MIKRPQTAIVGLKVRMREPLRKKLEQAAAKKGVSLNSELVARLESSFSGEAVEQVISAKVESALFANAEKLDRVTQLLERMESGAQEHGSARDQYFVVLHNGEWKVKHNGRYSHPYENQADAIRSAIQAAQTADQEAQVLVQGQQGTLRTGHKKIAREITHERQHHPTRKE